MHTSQELGWINVRNVNGKRADMENRVVVVTGANDGIGLSIVRALHRCGDHVAALDLSTENLAGIDSFICDVSNADLVQKTIREVVARWGRIDILVNNACLAGFSSFEEKPLSELRREFEVNYFGYVNMIKAVLPYMKAQRYGYIHNISSRAGITGFAGLSGYASANGAIEALSHTLAVELEPHGIVVNTVHPPLTLKKSSVSLGAPDRFMTDADEVGLKLARRLGIRKVTATTGVWPAIALFITRMIPRTVGWRIHNKAVAAWKRDFGREQK